MPPKKLEQYKYFQPIAWTLCLSFAGFVGILALQMQMEIQTFQDTSIDLGQNIQSTEEVSLNKVIE